MLSKPRSILINQPRSSYFVGGAELVALEHAKHMSERGCEVTFVTILPSSAGQSYSLQYLSVKELYASRIKFIELHQQAEAQEWYRIDPGENRDRWNVEALFYNRSLFQWIYVSPTRYDAMISYYKLDALIIPRNKISQNVLYLGGVPKNDNEFMSSFLGLYDTIIAITDEVRSYWQKYTHLPIRVIPTGVDASRFVPGSKSKELIEILSLGRLVERKGIGELIEACSLLPLEIKQLINVSIVGEGPQRENLKSLINDLGLEDVVHITGKTNTPERLLANASICIFPSKYGEGLQGVILESMAAGAFVIASNSQINRMLLGAYRGRIVSPGDVQGIAEAIVEAVGHIEQSITSGQAASAYVKKYYDWSAIVEDILEEIA